MPDCAVLVASVRALKMHGGVKKKDLKTENLKALEAGMSNLARKSRLWGLWRQTDGKGEVQSHPRARETRMLA